VAVAFIEFHDATAVEKAPKHAFTPWQDIARLLYRVRNCIELCNILTANWHGHDSSS
jgi:hypothetical protein